MAGAHEGLGDEIEHVYNISPSNGWPNQEGEPKLRNLFEVHEFSTP